MKEGASSIFGYAQAAWVQPTSSGVSVFGWKSAFRWQINIHSSTCLDGGLLSSAFS